MRIEAKEISKYYREGETAAKGLDDVSVTIEKGEFILVSGPSGCGKSTLAKCLSLNLECDEGELSLFGLDEFTMKESEKRKLLSSEVAYIGEVAFVESCSALDNVVFALLSSGIKLKEAKRMAKEALREVGLTKIHRKMGKLSGGERDRVMVARAISSPQTFIFLDEALANLDLASRNKCLKTLSERTEGKTVFLISHLPEDVLPYASRHIKMAEGKIISDDVLQEASANESKNTEESGKPFGLLISLKLLLSRPRRIVSSFLVCFALSAFLTFIAYSSTYLISNGNIRDSYNYAFTNHFYNRLVVEGKLENEISDTSYDDAGDLFSSLTLDVSSGEEERLFRSISLQPIMPDWEPAFGEKGEDGFYLLYDADKVYVSSLESSYLEARLGKTYDLKLNNTNSDLVLAKASLRGMFMVQDNDFLSGSAYCLCASPSLLAEIRESLLALLEEEIASTEKYYSSGPFARGGQELITAEKRLLSLSSEGIPTVKAAYLSLYGEELPDGKIYLPESMEGKAFTFKYKGTEISSDSVSGYLCYVPSVLSDGEWALSNATARKIAMELGIERSVYFGNRDDMASFKAANDSGLVIVDASQSEMVENDGGTILSLLGSGLFILAFVFVILSRFLLKRAHRSREEERNVLRLMGQPLSVLTLGETFITAIFFLLGLGASFAIYIVLVPNAARWLSRGLAFFVMAWLLGLILLPLPRFKEERK